MPPRHAFHPSLAGALALAACHSFSVEPGADTGDPDQDPDTAWPGEDPDPADDDAGGAPGDDDTSGAPGDDDSAPPGEQPAFDLVFKVHVEPLSVSGRPGLDERLDFYRMRIDQVDHVAEIAAAHGALLEVHGNGEFFEYVLEEGDEARVDAWIQAGHHLGVHAHSVAYQGPHDWQQVDVDGIDLESAADLWEGHEAFLRAVLPENDISAATPWDAGEEHAGTLMERFGYEMMGGGPNDVADEMLGHEVWNPFRYDHGTPLGEDPSGYAVLIPHRGQIGEAAPHGPDLTFRDNTAPHVEVMALQAYLERLAAQRHGDPPRRWVYGFLQHDNAGGEDGTLHDAEIERVLAFLDALFVAPAGGTPTTGRYATFPQVYQGFRQWEEANPGASSFRYAEGDPYPYHLYGLAVELAADAETRVDRMATVAHPDGSGTFVHRLERGARESASATPLWLMWRQDGAAATFDLSAELAAAGRGDAATVRVIDGETGAETAAPASAVPVGAVPVLAIP